MTISNMHILHESVCVWYVKKLILMKVNLDIFYMSIKNKKTFYFFTLSHL